MYDPLEKELMQRALEIAAAARGKTSPNPMVGALVVREGRVVGEGFHRRAGGAHAEAIALRKAGKAARGATLIVTLEPCSHYGRTPPCAEAVIRSGVRRVVVAMRDPNPLVGGRGIRMLRQAGIEVDVGLLGALAARLNEVFVHRMRHGRPFVALKLAQSLDGAIAAGPGIRTDISSRPSRRLTHRLRSMHDSVLVGVSTVLADDPLLNVRGIKGAHQPLRVVLDSGLRLPLESRLVATAMKFPTLVLYDADRAAAGVVEALRVRNVQLAPVRDAANGIIPPGEVLNTLAALGVTSVFIEGGRKVATSFLGARLVDRLHLFISPLLYGEGAPLHGIADIGVGGGAGPLRLVRPEREWIGPDIYLTGRLRYPEINFCLQP